MSSSHFPAASARLIQAFQKDLHGDRPKLCSVEVEENLRWLLYGDLVRDLCGKKVRMITEVEDAHLVFRIRWEVPRSPSILLVVGVISGPYPQVLFRQYPVTPLKLPAFFIH